jgi:hypothetical protein
MTYFPPIQSVVWGPPASHYWALVRTAESQAPPRPTESESVFSQDPR